MMTAQDLRLIWDWNAQVPLVADSCMHKLLAATVQRRYHATAVSAWDGELTYGQLDALSTRLGAELIKHGVAPEVIVPLAFEKSMWTPVAMLAVMKAGGASVLLDTTQPQERLSTIIRQVSPRIIVSSRLNMESCRQLHSCPVLDVDGQSIERLAGKSDPNLDWPRVSPSNALYVVFTSGSTGKPKATVITHSNFCTAVREGSGVLQFTEDARVFDFASYAFDVAWANALYTLAAGACLCIPFEDDRQRDLGAAITAFRATYVELTPTVAKLLCPSSVPTLKVLNLGGEAVDPSQFRDWAGAVRLLVTYGPAECTVTTSCATLHSDDIESARIGRPLGVSAWIVGEDGLCPIGAVGELWLEGPLVGRGYLNDLERTRAAFSEDPSWLLRGAPGRPGRRGRLYRTGDLVRYDTDGTGTLIFVGRKDTQVKIRGQRLELGEVEHHVRTAFTESIREQHETAEIIHLIAEMVTFKGSTRPSLVVFVSLAKTGSTTWTRDEHDGTVRNLANDSEHRLSARIPAYMIPTAYIPIKTIAITTAGKIDRQQLRILAATLSLERLSLLTAGNTSSSVAPRLPTTVIERQLLKLWAGILNTSDTIDLDTDFLLIGGDSITAMQVTAAARALNLPVTVELLIKQRTIRRISTILQSMDCNRSSISSNRESI